MSEDDEGNHSVSDHKTRKRKSFGRMRDVNKKLILQSHVTGDDCHCRLNCFNNVCEEERRKIIKHFNLLPSTNAQNQYLCGLITVMPVSRRRPRKPETEAKLRDATYKFKVLCCLAVLAALYESASGHGRLIEPPSRASAWRFGFDTPHNYNDHELYCGGFSRQWNKNDGKCGVCGDAWDSPQPRPHELGGRFGKGVIVRRYAPKDPITIKVDLTANHNGFFEFRVCEEAKGTTQECLDKHVLQVDGRDTTKFYPRDGNKIYEMKYRLPEGLECAHCVLQWRYIAGNNWGTCENGTGAVGCGPQEEFRACADIAIGDKFATTTRRPRPSYVPPSRRPTVPTPEESTGYSWYGLVIAVVALLVAVAILAGIYLYYYRGGMRIKSLLKSKSQAPAPVPPPRHKRASLSREVPPELTPSKGIPESGFETVDLRSK